MAKEHKVFVKKTKFFAILIVLLILLAGVFLYRYFTSNKQNNYLIENKYYGFKLQTPKNWFAEKNISYSEDNITQLLTECKNDKSNKASAYEIGVFRFKDQRYPQDFGISGYFPADLPSGAILEITVNCIPDSIKSKIGNYISGNLKVAGEKTFEEFLNLPEFGKTKYLSFLHDNFQYRVSEFVYISPSDKSDPKGDSKERLRENYVKAFDKIISSFKFTK